MLMAAMRLNIPDSGDVDGGMERVNERSAFGFDRRDD